MAFGQHFVFQNLVASLTSMPSEPQPSPISQLPRAGDVYGGGTIPVPVDTDLTIALVWHPHKNGTNNPGWVAIQIPFGDIYDLPINTPDAVGLLSQVQTVMAAAMQGAADAKKSYLKTNNILTQVMSVFQGVASYLAQASKYARGADNARVRADQHAQLAAGMASLAQSKLNMVRRQFSDSNLVGLGLSQSQRQNKQRPSNNAGSVIATEIFGG